MMVRAYAPAAYVLVLAFCAMALFWGWQNSAYLSGLWVYVRWIPALLLAASGIWMVLTTYWLRRWQHGEVPTCDCGGMLGVEARADGRSKIADNSFGDAEKAERRLAEAVLQQTDEGAEQQSCRRIAAAQSEIDCDQKRQIKHAELGNVNGDKGLQYQRKNHAENNRAAVKLVNFNMRFADTEIESVVHGFLPFAGGAGAG